MRRTPFISALAVLAALPHVARSASSAPDPAALQARMTAAHAAFAAGKHAAALAELLAVDALAPLPVVRFNIARCYEELGRPAEEVAAYERYLELADPDPVRLKRAREKLARLNARLFGRLEIVCEPAGADVVVQVEGDTRTAPGCPWTSDKVLAGTHKVEVSGADFAPFRETVRVSAGGTTRLVANVRRELGSFSVTSSVRGSEVFLGELLLNAAPIEKTSVPPGPHVVTVRAPGYQDYRREIDIRPGEHVDVNAVLTPAVAREPDAAPPALEPATEPVPAVASEAGTSALPVVLTCIAAGALVGGGVFYFRAREDVDRLNAANRRGDASGARDEFHAAELDRALGYGLLGGGAALGLGAVIAFALESEPAGAPVLGNPGLAPIGATFGGRF